MLRAPKSKLAAAAVWLCDRVAWLDLAWAHVGTNQLLSHAVLKFTEVADQFVEICKQGSVRIRQPTSMQRQSHSASEAA